MNHWGTLTPVPAARVCSAGLWQWTLLALLVIGLAACAPVAPRSQKVAKIPQTLLWPMPPDLPRFEFETVLQSVADIAPATDDDRWKRMLQGQPDTSDALAINKPSAIVSRGGRVYVAEPGARAITVFDAARKRLFRFGLREPNVLKRPQALALDDAGKVYVLDAQLRKVMIFDGMGLFLDSIALGRRFSNPVGIAVQGDGQTVYVVDRGNVDQDDHKVVALAPDGTEGIRIGPRGSGPGQFNIPLAAAVAADGTLYVVDSGNFRVQAFNAKGEFKFQFGGAGVGIGQFSRPRAISLDHEGNIYVSDGGFNNVQIFNSAGQLLMPLGRLSREPGPGNYALIAGIAIDETRRLYVVDHYFKKIEVFRRLSDEEALQKATAHKRAAS